ncbi:peroxisomal membrane protein 4-like [Lineus longissimus]|uniref:peroxisomal membrane protein 4-like n=1 Tax=Lineus longissimus TaxID=88925 RepID=UPI002B4DCE02
MAAAMVAINGLLKNEQYRPFLSLLKGFRNGAVYGAKVRAPHAFVMTFLFRSGSFQQKFKSIAEATFTHSKNLASFVFTYKTLSLLMQWLQREKSQIHAFIAAFIGGWLVFGQYNKVNEQINLYLLSRILYALAKLAVKNGYIPQPKNAPFPLFGAIVWGVVLWLFEYERDTLQNSLTSSMTYLYDDSTIWTNIKDFLFYNNDRVW